MMKTKTKATIAIVAMMICFLLGAVSLCSQEYTVISVTDSTVALKETTIGQDNLISENYLTGAIDSASMVQSLFGFIQSRRIGEARAIRRAKEFEAEGNALNSISNAFSDSLYFDWTKANYANQFVAKSINKPNYKIRVGTNL